MNSITLKLTRIRKNRSEQYMANIIGRNLASYIKRENGLVPFRPMEIAAISIDLELGLEQMNDIFFDGNLPFRKFANEAIRSVS